MPRRSLLTLLILASLVLIAVVAPRTPQGRDWLLSQLRQAAADAGWTLAWRDSAGNPWRELQLRGVQVAGPGVDARLGTVRIAWFAPGLLTGELPLWIAIDDADVGLDPAGLSSLTSGDGGGSGAGLPVRPELRDLDLRGVRVRIGGAAYLLPDLRVENLEVRGSGNDLRALGVVSTRDGAVDLDARMNLPQGTVEAQLENLELRIARAWWTGVSGGTASGTVAYTQADGFTAELDVRDGTLEVVGLQVDAIAGPVQLHGGLIEAELSGSSLGGSVAASGRVDIANRRWSAESSATPTLEEAARWAARDALPARLLPSGDALLTASASGWASVEVDATLTGAGTLEGAPFEIATDSARYATDSGFQIEAALQALGGSATVAVRGAGRRDGVGLEPTTISVDVTNVAYGPTRDLTGRLNYRLQPGQAASGDFGLQGALHAGSAAAAAPITRFQSDGTIEAGAIDLFISAQPQIGGTLEGAASLSAGELRGALRLSDAGPLAGEPVALEISAEGPLSHLNLTASLVGERAWRPELPGVPAGADLRGSLSATLDGATLRAIAGSFGPLSLTGELSLTSGTATEPLAWTLAETPVGSAAISSVVRVDGGTITPWTPSGTRVQGALTLADVTVPGATLAATTGRLTLELPWLPSRAAEATLPITASFTASTITARLGADRVELTADRHPLTVAERTGPLSADLSLDPSAPIESLTGTLAYLAGAAERPALIELQAQGGTVAASARIPTGTEVAGVTTPGPLELDATLRSDASGELRLSTGVGGPAAVTFAGTIAPWTGVDSFELDGTLLSGADAASLRIDGGPWRVTLDGNVDVAPIAAWLGSEAAGRLQARDLSVTRDAASGGAELRLGAPLQALLNWRDGTISGSVATPLGEATVAGAALPGSPYHLTVSHRWGDARLDQAGLTGSGTVPAQAWRGVRLDPLPWSVLPGSSPTDLQLRVGDGRASFRDGRLEAVADLPASIGDRPARITGTVRSAAATSDLLLDLAATTTAAAANESAATVTATGALTELRVDLAVDATTLLRAAQLQADVRGRIVAGATVNLPGRSGSLDGRWSAGERSLRLNAQLDDEGVRVDLRGEDLDLTWQPGELTLIASSARIGAFLPAAEELILDGALTARSAAGAEAGTLDPTSALWHGEITVTAPPYGSATLVGDGPQLLTRAAVSAAGAQATIEGRVLPELDLTVLAEQPASGALADFTLTGPLAWQGDDAARIAGTISLPEFRAGEYALAASRAQLAGTLAAPRLIDATGATLALATAGWSGALGLTVTIDGRPHPLALTASGPAGAPLLEATLAGPDLSGDLRYDVAAAAGTFEARILPTALPEQAAVANLETTTVHGTFQSDGRWTAEIRSSAHPQGRPLAVTLTARGHSADAQVDWSAEAAGTPLLRGEATIDRQELTVTSDLAGWNVAQIVAWSAGADAPLVQGAGSGSLSYRLPWSDPSAATLNGAASLAGRIGDQPFRLLTDLREPRGRVRLDRGPDTLAIEGVAGDNLWTFQAAGDAYALSGRLQRDLQSAQLAGSLAGEPLELRLAREASGALVAAGRWSDAQLNLGLAPRDGGWSVRLDASVPAGTARPLAGTLSGEALVQGTEVTLRRLDLALTSPQMLELTLAGLAWPRAELRGSGTGLLPPDRGPIDVTVLAEADADGLHSEVTASLDGLDLSAELLGTEIQRLALEGSGNELFGVRLTPDEGGLAWASDGGWTGGAGVTTAGIGSGRLDGRGQRLAGDLQLHWSAPVENGEAPPVTVVLTLAPELEGAPWGATLHGEGRLQALLTGDVESAAPGLQLDAPLRLEGELASPRLTGEATLSGATNASGPLQVDRQGARLELTGDQLELDAEVDSGGWHAQVGIAGLALRPWLPAVNGVRLGDEARLDAQLRANGAWGDRPRLLVDPLLISAGASELRGSAELNGGWRAAGSLDVDLAELLGDAASGRLAGPLSIRAEAGAPLTEATVTGALRAQAVRIAELSIDGEAALDGTLPVPNLRADLTLGGPLSGRLRLGWRPADGRIDLTTELTGRLAGTEWSSDLAVAGTPSGLGASGSFVTNDGRLDANGEGDELILTGADGWDGARLVLRPFARPLPTAQATWPLATLATGLSGTLQLALDPAADDWASGRIERPSAGPVELGDLTLLARADRLTLTSDSLDAEANLSDGTWTATTRLLPLAGFGRVDAEVHGTGANLEARGTLHDPDGESLDFEAQAAGAGLSLQAQGRYASAGATLDVQRSAEPAGGWSGDVSIVGLNSPAGTVSAQGRVAGRGSLPNATFDVTVAGPVPTSGTVTVGSETTGSESDPSEPDHPLGVTVELTGELPGGQALQLNGRIWPGIELQLEGDDGAATVTAPAWSGGEPWTVAGTTRVSLFGATVTLDRVPGPSAAPRLSVETDVLPDMRVAIELPSAAPLEAVARIGREGLDAQASGSITGAASWTPAAAAGDGVPGDRFELHALRWDGPVGALRLDGRVTVGDLSNLEGATLDLTGEIAAPDPETSLAAGLWSDVTGAVAVPLRLTGTLADALLRLGPDGLDGNLRWRAADQSIEATVAAEQVELTLRLAPGAGLVGSATVRAFEVAVPVGATTRPARLSGTVSVDGGTLQGEASVAGPGDLRLDASADLTRFLPAAYRPEGTTASVPQADRVSMRISELDVAVLPGVASNLPQLAGGLSGVAELRGSRLLLQLAAPELRTAGRATPFRLDAAGDLSGAGLTFSGSLAGSTLQGSADLTRLDLLLRMERFPAQAPIEAAFGPLDAEVEATGVLRLGLPWSDPLAGDLRVATEHVRLERAGVVTTGTLTAQADAGRLLVDAAFEGEGSWFAQGTVARDDLDFRFEARDANGTPLLGLVPALVRLGAQASGSLQVTADGSPGDPRIAASSDGLEIALAGARYRFDEADVRLDGPDLSLRGVLRGVDPVGGRVDVAGTGSLRLDPFRLDDAAVDLTGDLNVPLLGEVSDLDGRIDVDSEGRPRLRVDGRIGAPLRASGTLFPLDVRLRGAGLALRIPSVLLGRSTSTLDLRLRYDERLQLSGRIEVFEGRFALGIRPAAAARASTPAAVGTAPAPRDRTALTRFVFDDVTIVGRRLSFSENFGSADFDADLRLSGNAAAPRLSGRALAQRGTFRFSGRDFDVRTGVARFEPSRGAYPSVEVVAVAEFDKRAALQGAPAGVTFEQPPGAGFEVRLAFDAEMVATPGEARPFRFEIDPLLTSNAIISIPAGEGNGAGARLLREEELLSLVALGRLDLASDLASAGVATGVARSALDSAVDLLVLAELQSAVSQALGIDLVEIRTSTLSSVLAGSDDPFAVSLRLGGYLGEGLFASFEVGRFADADASEALSNTLALTYQLGPVAFDLSTRLAFPDAIASTPTTELAGTLRYQLTPFLAVEGGATLSTPESEARFGVTLRW